MIEFTDRLEKQHRGDSKANGNDLAERTALEGATMQARDEIRHGHVEEARRGNREEVRQDLGQVSDGKPCQQDARHGGQTGQNVEPEGAHPRITCPEQDREVADLLGDLVGGHRKGRRHAERHRDGCGSGNDGAVDEVVDRIADQDERGGRVVHLAVVRVAVSPQHEFLEDEEGDDAAKQPSTAPSPNDLGENQDLPSIEGMIAQQRADGEADEPRDELHSYVVLEEQQRGGDEQTAETSKQRQPDGDRKSRHLRRWYQRLVAGSQ